MKKYFLLLMIAGTSVMVNAQVKTPAPSTSQTVKQEFGLGSIELSYARPNIKGRTVFGDLVPYGNVWRTGANGATTLSFTDEVSIGGTKLAPGKYGLLSIPGAKEWTLIISKQTDVTSPAAYKQDMDVVRVKAAVKKQLSKTETFTIQIANVKDNSCDLQIIWDNALVTLPIKTDVDTRIMNSIEAAMKTDKPPYAAAAAYYMNNGKDLNQAITWYKKATEAQPSAFWLFHQMANCYAKMGKKADAIAAAKKSMEIAEKAQSADYVALNKKLLAQLAK